MGLAGVFQGVQSLAQLLPTAARLNVFTARQFEQRRNVYRVRLSVSGIEAVQPPATARAGGRSARCAHPIRFA